MRSSSLLPLFTLLGMLPGCGDASVADAVDAAPAGRDAPTVLTPDAAPAAALDAPAAPTVDAAAIDATADLDAAPDAGSPALPALTFCLGHDPFVPTPAGGWLSSGSSIVAALGAPAHSAQDVVVPEGSAITVPGKFAYGSLSYDLGGEAVIVFIDRCAGWEQLGTAVTDDDGRIAFPVGLPLPVGVYDVRLEVVGDASFARSAIWVLPTGTHLAVFDIDGTLTTGDDELFTMIFDGSYVPEAYPSAMELTSAERQILRVPLYLTGRPYWLAEPTRAWLDDLGFTAGPLHTTDSNTESLPTDGNVGTYKRDFLTGLVGAGFILDDAYGNATTDIFAYSGAGLAASTIWIIGDNGGTDGTNAVTGSWADRTSELQAMPPVDQPFTW